MAAQPRPATGSVDPAVNSTTTQTSIIVPSIKLGLSTASVGSSVPFTGSGFSANDTTCSPSGPVVSIPSCTITGGTIIGSFVVANVASGSYSVKVTGNINGIVNDFASATLVVTYTSAGAAISLSPTSGPVGIGIHVSGTGFSSSDTGCSLSGSPVSSGTCSIYSGGTLVGSFIVANVALASYTVTATGNVTGDHASASFTVTGGSPTITLSPSSAPAGSTVHVSGSGFALSDGLCSMSGGGSMVTASISCSLSGGIITGSFTVANSSRGGYSVVVTGSPNGDFASAVFTITTSQTSNTASTTTTQTSTTTHASSTTTQTSTSTSSSTSATTQTTTQSSTSNNTATIGDFSISSSATTIVLAPIQGSTGSVTITVHSLNGFSSPVTLTPSWFGNAPAGIVPSITSPVTPPSGGNATSTLILTSSSSASQGNFTIRLTGTSGSLNHNLSPDIIVHVTQPTSTTTTSSTATSSTSTTSTTSSSPLPTGCPVSYALSGSVVAPLAQKLRMFRDQSVMKTRSGLAFMILFNTWYYSFSLHLTSYVSTHQTQRALLGYSLYPLIAILYTSYYSYLLVSPLSPDGGVIIAGILAASLLGLVYLAPIGYIATLILKRHVKCYASSAIRMLLWWCMISVTSVGITYFAQPGLLGIVTVNLTLSTLTLSGILGVHMLSRLQLKCTWIGIPRFVLGRNFRTPALDRNL